MKFAWGYRISCGIVAQNCLGSLPCLFWGCMSVFSCYNAVVVKVGVAITQLLRWDKITLHYHDMPAHIYRRELVEGSVKMPPLYIGGI